jgi:hypothetical protein
VELDAMPASITLRKPERGLNVTTQCYYPFLDESGRPWKVRALSRELAAAGHAVSIVTADLGVARGFAKLYRPRPAPDDSLRICADAHVVSSVARTKPVRIADMDLPAPHQGRQFRASGSDAALD